HSAELDVEEETIDLSYCSTIEEFLRRCKDHGRKALCAQQGLNGIERTGIVIHDCHYRPTRQHEMSGLSSDRKPKQGADFYRTSIMTNRRAAGLSLGECIWTQPPLDRARPLRNAIDAPNSLCSSVAFHSSLLLRCRSDAKEIVSSSYASRSVPFNCRRLPGS